MNIPYFFLPDLNPDDEYFVLNEETSKHVVQVLRMQNGESVKLTNGKGLLLTAIIVDNHKKHCKVQKTEALHVPPSSKNNAIAISLLKNPSRLEWFLEKAAELGIRHIIPLKCKRTEKQHFRTDRMQGILISAMLQSQQSTLCTLSEPMTMEMLVKDCHFKNKYIAHCEANEEKILLSAGDVHEHDLVLIGPEGDFTSEEIRLALDHGFKPISLGDTRLRTETAAMTAAVLLQVS